VTVLAARMSSSGTALPVHVRGFGPLQVGFRVSCRYVFVVPNETTTAYEVGVHVAGITAPAVSVIVRQAAAVQPDEHGAAPEPSASNTDAALTRAASASAQASPTQPGAHAHVSGATHAPPFSHARAHTAHRSSARRWRG
jgi:hypothetical protein